MGIQDAATVLLLKEGSLDPVVLMLQRSRSLDFLGGAHVFPGGKVDEADRSAELFDLCDGWDDGGCSSSLGLKERDLSYFIAGIRECFEEVGMFLARASGDGRLSDSGDALVGGDAAESVIINESRESLNAGSMSFLEVCTDLGVRLACDQLYCYSHWVSPEGLMKRYDTRFLIGFAPSDQLATPDSSEIVDHIWITPAQAIERQQSGEFKMIIPTIKNLEALLPFHSAIEAISAAERSGQIVPITPKLVRDEGGLRILLPEDEGYLEAESTELQPGEAIPMSVEPIS